MGSMHWRVVGIAVRGREAASRSYDESTGAWYNGRMSRALVMYGRKEATYSCRLVRLRFDCI